MTFPRYARPFGIGFAVLLGVALLATGCDDDTTGPSPGPRAFNQVQRLGNPLVSEVLLEKRDHDTHGSTGPDQDAARIAARVKSFIINVAGRASAYADVLGGVLVPDMLIVQTDRPGNTAGWLNWVGIAPLANGYGGRQLSDDVTDLALLAVFGDPFGADPVGAAGKTRLTTDNVSCTGCPFATTFPYLKAPN